MHLYIVILTSYPLINLLSLSDIQVIGVWTPTHSYLNILIYYAKISLNRFNCSNPNSFRPYLSRRKNNTSSAKGVSGVKSEGVRFAKRDQNLSEKIEIFVQGKILVLVILELGRYFFIRCLLQRIQINWVFATSSRFLIPISLQPNVVDLRYFKQWILLDQII